MRLRARYILTDASQELHTLTAALLEAGSAGDRASADLQPALAKTHEPVIAAAIVPDV